MSFSLVFVFSLRSVSFALGFQPVSLPMPREMHPKHHVSTWTLLSRLQQWTRAAQRELLLCAHQWWSGILLLLPFIFNYHFLKLENCGAWLQRCACGSAGKESTCNMGDLGSIPGLGGSSGEQKGYPLKYSGLENSIEYIVREVAKSRTWLSKLHFHFTVWSRGSENVTEAQCLYFSICSAFRHAFVGFIQTGSDS